MANQLANGIPMYYFHSTWLNVRITKHTVGYSVNRQQHFTFSIVDRFTVCFLMNVHLENLVTTLCKTKFYSDTIRVRTACVANSYSRLYSYMLA